MGGDIYVWNEDLKFPDLLDLPHERIEIQKITNQLEQSNKLKGFSQGFFQNGRQMRLWHSGNLRKLQTMLQPFVRPSLLKPSVSKYKNKGISSPTSNLLYSMLNPRAVDKVIHHKHQVPSSYSYSASSFVSTIDSRSHRRHLAPASEPKHSPKPMRAPVT